MPQFVPITSIGNCARAVSAAAISVLTEPTHFGGSEADLVQVHDAIDAPVLRKDFIIDEAQIIESRAWGASAVLLIARALPRAALSSLAKSAREWGIEPLIEVRWDHQVTGIAQDQQGVTRLDVVNYISHGITKTPQAHQGSKAEQEAEQKRSVVRPV